MIRKRRTLVISLALAAVTLTVLAGCGSGSNSTSSAAAGDTTAATTQPAKQPILTGSFDGKPVTYFDFADIKLEAGNPTAGIWKVTDGASGQQAIFDNVPGAADYSALRKVTEVKWVQGKTARVLASVADVDAAKAAGDVTVTPTAQVINAPVLEFGQERHAGYAKNETIEYYELGKVKVAPGNKVLPIYTFTNGVADQKNIADTTPGTTAYPPLWAVVAITWSDSATPRLITSFEDVKTAEAAGELTLKNTPDVVNCPFL